MDLSIDLQNRRQPIHGARPSTFVARVVILLAFSSATLAVRNSALGEEPFRITSLVNVTAAETQPIDHLRPASPGHPIPEFSYLAQYWAEISEQDYHYVAVFRDESTGKCYVGQGKRPTGRTRSLPYHGPIPKFANQREISTATATAIYELWVNSLLDTRYDRHGSTFSLGGTVYAFSTFVLGIGYMHGVTYTGTSPDLPPYWISQAGEALFVFATKSQDEDQLRQRITSKRDQVFEYLNRR